MPLFGPAMDELAKYMHENQYMSNEEYMAYQRSKRIKTIVITLAFVLLAIMISFLI